MNKIGLVFWMTVISFSVFAQDIKLPEPQKSGGEPLMDALMERHSTREYSSKEIELRTLSNLLWATWGFNRENKRTAPSSMNRQEMDVYVVTEKGLYLYDARENMLKQILQEDIREFCGKQEYVHTAPLNFIYVSDMQRLKSDNMEDEPLASYLNTGFMAQNAYLYCANVGLGSVVRSWIDMEKLHQKMKLKPYQKIILGQTFGWPK